MLLLSLVLALIPLAGIAWIFISKTLFSVDGLFMSLILLSISGIFLLNVALELKALGWLARHKADAAASKAAPAAKAD
jgi:uncharacterized membrane protein